MDQHEHQFRKWEAEHKAWADTRQALMKAQMDFAALALKGITLVNGAAAVALLAFLGHVVAAALSNDVKSQGAGVRVLTAIELMRPMAAFIIGTASGIIATAIAYLAQTVFVEGKLESKPTKWIAEILRGLAVVVAAGGLAAFCFGGWWAVADFSDSLAKFAAPAQ